MKRVENSSVFPFDVEPIPPSGIAADGVLTIVYKEIVMTVHNTNNLWGYVKATITEEKSLLKSVADGLGMATYVQRLHLTYPRLGAHVTALAVENQAVLKALYGQEHTPEASDTYAEWRQKRLESGEIFLVCSLVYDALAPMLLADGRDPREILI